MATCADCIHYEVCSDYFDATIECGSTCSFLKDRSRFVELPCAEWIEDEDMYGDPIYRCSNCDEHFILEEGTPTDNGYFYCPNCGAKMDEQALKERETNGQSQN